MVTLTIIGILCLVVLLTCLAETDNGGWGIVSIIAVALVCEFWLFKGTASVVWSYIAANPGIIIVFGWLYICFGVGWSILKWKMWVNDWVKQNPDRVADLQARFLKDGHAQTEYGISPSHNKSRLISWMGYWPFSFGWFIIHKPFTRLYNWLYERLTGVYQQISNSVYKKPTT
jgi:hypothetical protein